MTLRQARVLAGMALTLDQIGPFMKQGETDFMNGPY